MSLAVVAGHEVHVDEEGFMTEFAEWSEEMAGELAGAIGIELTERHMDAIRFLREDFQSQGVTPTLRGCRPKAGSRQRNCFSSSQRSRPRRWHTSPDCQSQLAASRKEMK